MWGFEMKTRDNLTNKTFSNLLAVKYVKTKNTHAIWECKCLLCGSVINVSASNLKSGNSKSCSSCGKKATTPETEKEIVKLLNKRKTVSSIAKQFHVSRHIVYRIKREALR